MPPLRGSESAGDGAEGLRRPALGRLPVRTVERLHAVLAGDPVTEGMVLTFIGVRYGARNLYFLPTNVAEQALKRQADFIRAVKRHCEPELPF